ncbi:nucleolar protein 6-like [Fagus crenata]
MESVTDSNSMDLKVTELLNEVRLDYSPALTKHVNDTVSAIKDAIDKIPEDFQVTANAAPGFVRDIGADKVEFKFKKPKCIEIGGSYAIQCLAKPEINVDLFIQLPKECFHEKDYLNYRYHAKRCLYLSIIKKHLKCSSLVHKVEWSTLQNEARKPVLVVYPAKELVEIPGFFVRIIPTAKSLFPIKKLNLKRNNIRAVTHGGMPQATPKYNSSILEDMFLEDTAEVIKKTFLGWKELGEASILLKVWARQRSSIYVHDCLNGFLISVILSYLASQNKIDTSMKAMQIFRVTLNFIATAKSWKNGLYFKREGQRGIQQEERVPYKETFPVVIFDPSAPFNMAFRISRIGFVELQDEAALTLRCIEKCRDGGFEEIFMTKIDYAAKYDYCIRLNLKGKSEVHASGFCLDDECWRLYEQKVQSLLNQGLSNRAKLIRVTWRNTLSECSIENGLSKFDREPLLVGVSVGSLEKAFSVVDTGPTAENKDEALKFRKFWGEKAELRRFKDGTIAESTVWESEHWTRHLILKRISEYVLMRHLSLSKENIVHIVDQLDFSLLHGVRDPISFSVSLLEAFDVLSKRLRSDEKKDKDIPLKVSSVHPLDPAFRFTSVFPPKPHPLANDKGDVSRLQKLMPSCIQPLEVLIELEGNGNWPKDEIAIEKTKTACLLQIGESLQNTWGMTCTATEDDVDVFMSGYVFRLKIMHENALSLSERENESEQVKFVSSTDKKLFVRKQHSSMINGLQGRYPLYGPVVRLAKRWVASHLFSACLVEEAIELLVAYLFVKPLPFNAPCSRITGFLRFLRLLSEYDWIFSALVVDIKEDMSPNDEKEISDNFMVIRKGYEENKQNVSPAMFLATNYDKLSEAWTRFSPNLSELKRLGAYARSSANLLTNLILQDQIDSYKWECLLRTPLNNYDAVILLHREKLPYPHRLLFPSELNQGKHVAQGNASKVFQPFMGPGDFKGSSKELKNKLLVNFDPLRCFVGDLEKEFSNMFKVWYDSLGGDAIGVTWERFSSKKRDREEASEEGEDPVDVLKAVGEVGKGFVRSVYSLKSPRLMN